MATIYRTVGDSGDLAAITYTITDADGTPVTSGTVTLRIAGVADLPMSHDADGVWTWTPGPSDLDLEAGRYDLEVHAVEVTVPRTFDRLVLRARAEAP